MQKGKGGKGREVRREEKGVGKERKAGGRREGARNGKSAQDKSHCM